MRVDGQEPGTRRERRTSGPLTAKSISIKDAKRRPGDRARKATELTPGDLFCVASATENVVRHPDRRAEVSRGIIGHVVGKASEALRRRKVESTDRPRRERGLKART